MSGRVVVVTVQAVMFSALSTTLAQSIRAWRHQKLSFDLTPFIIFMTIAVIMTPPNYLYQRFMEDTFPSRVPIAPTKPGERKKTDDADKPVETERLSKTNTAKKFFIDQSISASLNTIVFIFLLGLFKGKTLTVINHDLHKEFWPMLSAGWRVWPVVTLLNLCVIPFDYRMLVGNTAGVLWGVYITLRTM